MGIEIGWKGEPPCHSERIVQYSQNTGEGKLRQSGSKSLLVAVNGCILSRCEHAIHGIGLNIEFAD